VTVAGAARDSHPLPFARRIKEPKRRQDTPERRDFQPPSSRAQRGIPDSIAVRAIKHGILGMTLSGYNPAQNARPRLHARPRPHAAHRFPRSRAGPGEERCPAHGDLPTALACARCPGDALDGADVGGSFDFAAPGPRRLRSPIGDVASFGRKADAASRGHRGRRHGRDIRYGGRGRGAPVARIPGRLLDSRAGRRGRRRPAPAVPP
jgi:hypothetical protein